jgi:hypothetical protein
MRAPAHGCRRPSRRSQAVLAKCPVVAPTKAKRSPRYHGSSRAAQRLQRGPAQRVEQVVQRERRRVVHVHAGLAAAARALPDAVAPQAVVADARGVGGELAQLGQAQRRVGDPFVESGP